MEGRLNSDINSLYTLCIFIQNYRNNLLILYQNLGALNDSGSIKSMYAREDGVYITYIPAAGADTVTKKLGEPQIATFSLTKNAGHPSFSWTAPGKIVAAGLTSCHSTADPGGNYPTGLSCTFSGNVVNIATWKYGGTVSVSGFAVYE